MYQVCNYFGRCFIFHHQTMQVLSSDIKGTSSAELQMSQILLNLPRNFFFKASMAYMIEMQTFMASYFCLKKVKNLNIIVS